MKNSTRVLELTNRFSAHRSGWSTFLSFLTALALFWILLLVRIPDSFTRYFHSYSLGLFLIVLAGYFISFRLPESSRLLVGLSLTMVLFALTLSYKWTSGYSDNKIIAGLLPYKDGSGYYTGAYFILNGIPVADAIRANWRPLFSGFLSSMLLLTGGSLKWALAILVGLAGMAAYSSASLFFKKCGAFPAGLFMTFLYFFIQPLLGLVMTEMVGFTVGCLAFSLIWRAAHNLNLSDLIFGLLMLVLALSVRAGTFLILPILALWAGWIFRGSERFAWKVFALALVTIPLGYAVANMLYFRSIGVPEGTAFGNFAYSIYGQVRGGVGWHFAIEELGTRTPSIIYREAFQFFLKHPASLFIGAAKSYRDFFLPGNLSIFPFDVRGNLSWIHYILWGMTVLLIARAFLLHKFSIVGLLMQTSMIGFLLSIPFLPPIDGGSRFYASSIPFFFCLPALGLTRSFDPFADPAEKKADRNEKVLLQTGSILVGLLTIVLPPVMQRFGSLPEPAIPVCSATQTAFVTRLYPGSYVDLVTSNRECGLLPEICFDDFDKNGVEKNVDDFYQWLHSMTAGRPNDVRILLTVDFLDQQFHYIYVDANQFPSHGVVSGCAAEIRTKNQSIYLVESWSAVGE